MIDASTALLSADDGPRAIVTPTRQSLPKTLRLALEARGHLILPLSEITNFDEASGLVGVQPAELLLAPLRDKLLASRSTASPPRQWALPPTARWEDLHFEFTAAEVVNVRYGKQSRRCEPDDFGMKNQKNGRPTSAWVLLQALAANGGRLSWKDPQASGRVKKQKQLLSRSLKGIFGLTDDPLPWKKSSGAYVTLFRIRNSAPVRGAG